MKLKKVGVLFIAWLWCLHTQAQDFMLQGWFWDYPKTSQGANWCDTMRIKGYEWQQAGFNYIWAPPMNPTGSGPASNGYDIRDYFSVGGFPQPATGFGTRAKVDALINAYNQLNLNLVGDLIYNHRNGGLWENNSAVASWIKTYNATKHIAGDACYPSDRFRCRITIGGNTGRGAGTYYFRIRSASQHSDYYNKPYTFIASTQKSPPNGTFMSESQNNGGVLCGQAFDVVALGKRVNATIDNGGCGIDEYAITLDTSNFNSAGDVITISMINSNGDYTDHVIHSLYDATNVQELKDSILYQTATDFSFVQSGRGQMSWQNFKPNGNPTNLNGDWDKMLFFYDLDQFDAGTRDTLNEYTKWMFDTIGIKGVRADAVKNFAPDFIGQLLNYLHANNINPGMFVGESYEYNPVLLKGWVDAVKSKMNQSALNAISPKVFDFALQAALREACDNGGFDARDVFTSGIVDGAGGSGFHTATFVNNHDFRDSSQSADFNQLLAYVYILTNNVLGVPCVYYPDYYKGAAYTATVNNLIDLHKKFVFNTAFREYLNRKFTPFSANYISGSADKSLIYQLSGGGNSSCLANRDVIVAINFGYSTLKVDHAINTGAPFHSQQGDTLHCILGNSAFPYALVNGSNQIYMEVPPRSFAIWVRVPQTIPSVVTIANTSICANDSTLLTAANPLSCVTYQWQLNGNNIPFANKPTYYAKLPGIYHCLTSYYGKMNTFSNTVTLAVSPDEPQISVVGNTLSAIGVSQAVSYQWYYSATNSNFTPGGNTQLITNCAAGYYYVIVIDGSGCANQSQVFQLQFASQPDISKNDNFYISPNPATHSFFIKNNYGTPAELFIYDIFGKKVIHQFFNFMSNEWLVNIAPLTPGMYVVEIHSGESVQRTLLEKMH